MHAGVEELKQKAETLLNYGSSSSEKKSSKSDSGRSHGQRSSTGSESPKSNNSQSAQNAGSRGPYTQEQEEGSRKIIEAAKRSHYEVSVCNRICGRSYDVISGIGGSTHGK